MLSKVGLQRREKTLTSHVCLWLSLPDAASGETRAHLLGETEAQVLVGLTQGPQQLLVEPGSGALPGMGKPGVRQGFLGEGVRRQEAQDWWGLKTIVSITEWGSTRGSLPRSPPPLSWELGTRGLLSAQLGSRKKLPHIDPTQPGPRPSLRGWGTALP